MIEQLKRVIKMLDNLSKLSSDNHSTFTRKELKTQFSNYDLSKMEKNNDIERSERGIYTLNDYLPDMFSIYQLKYQRGIYCLNTALYLLDFSDRYPDKLDMMFPQGYNTSKISTQISAHTQLSKYFDLGIIKVKTMNGNEVKTYSLERTLAEILRPQNHVDPDIVTNAYKKWTNRKNKDIGELFLFAQKFKTINQVQSYLEVLL